MDREFDDLALERWFSETSRKWIIRAQHLGRKVLLWGRPTTLRNAVRSAPRSVMGTVEREGKSYELRVAETFVDFHGRAYRRRRPGDRPKKRAPLSVRVVIAELYRGGRRAHQWVLLTNLGEPAEQIARVYTWRWRVERLFFFIKVGMRLETWGEQDGLRIARRLALCSLAAMAIYQLRAASGDPAHAEVIQRIATLGGWLGRKRDPIGPIVLMRGMLRFLGTLALLDQFGIDGVWNMARSLSEALGLLLRRAPGWRQCVRQRRPRAHLLHRDAGHPPRRHWMPARPRSTSSDPAQDRARRDRAARTGAASTARGARRANTATARFGAPARPSRGRLVLVAVEDHRRDDVALRGLCPQGPRRGRAARARGRGTGEHRCGLVSRDQRGGAAARPLASSAASWQGPHAQRHWRNSYPARKCSPS
jgi:hypothetical protein